MRQQMSSVGSRLVPTVQKRTMGERRGEERREEENNEDADGYRLGQRSGTKISRPLSDISRRRPVTMFCDNFLFVCSSLSEL